MSAALLVRTLRDPSGVANLDADGWNRLLAAAKAERLIGTLADLLAAHAVPPAVRAILDDAAADAAREAQQALWEADRAAYALRDSGIRVVLLKGAAYAVETLTPYLEASGTGSIVMLSSTAALETFIAPNPFNAIKAALITYASQLSQAYAAKGIRVNTVSPGAIYYKGGNWEIIEEHMKPLFDGTLAKMPMGRFGEPVEVAKAIVFVASPAVPYMTGANIVVDGGFTQRVQF